MAIRPANIVVMVKAAEKAGRSLLHDFGEVEQLQVSRKGPADFVSQADIQAERLIRQELEKARPGYGFQMEESQESAGDGRHRWIVDPLDGTSNFLHGLPHFAVSIALEKDGELISAVVFDAAKHELFWAERGVGAFLNDRRLRVSARRQMNEALIATGIPFVGRGDHQDYLGRLGRVMAQVAGVRRFGAAALDLAYVAAGRFDGFFEAGLQPWDMAAGILLVREAGGFVTDYAGAKADPRSGSVLASNGQIHKELAATVEGR
jgi:myo-inositol-1(or 4)-monophosphatase